MPETRSAEAPIGVVIVDADPTQRRALTGMLARESRFRISVHATHDEAREAAGASDRNIVIADLDTVGGPEALAAAFGGPARLIATSADVSLNTAIAALRGGAVDFLPKPFGARALLEKVEAALAASPDGWRRDDTPARQAPAPSPGSLPSPAEAGQGVDFASFVGRSPAMRAVYDQIAGVARSSAPVFVTGESGTGKELCAEAIHAAGGAERPFVALNCSAIPAELMESEMFGHVRGAFTGAHGDRTGAAELAHGGTLFLDEIAEMDIRLQAKLLRFLQSGEIRPIGGTATRKVEVRVVCATNRDPLDEVAAGRFRADLYYRLHVLPIRLPPLRERGDDVILLAEALRDRFAAEEGKAPAAFDDDVLAAFYGHAWPGNVRQLANVVRRMVILADSDRLDASLLPPEIDAGAGIDPGRPATEAAAGPVAVRPMWQHERDIIEAAIAAFGGNITRAAAALEINPSTIYRKRQAWAAGPRPLAQGGPEADHGCVSAATDRTER